MLGICRRRASCNFRVLLRRRAIGQLQDKVALRNVLKVDQQPLVQVEFDPLELLEFLRADFLPMNAIEARPSSTLSSKFLRCNRGNQAPL